ncbi:branched-chain amino acid ABC transporter permease [Variovorax sp. CY25R-8]|uniref:branched-chain amino acid ABC transporter permease n=1 Tax=Variovorax sp. CY25R-8 TaxID=2855501 RepID=UPI0021BAC0C2|nr:branched-chain amino acid ABC transporter permease [Variovorax sp. CY25R-8]MCT8179220.1 branched-chain amino acid ABC transporter permease [Variovorax sp. CY25R-8]
MTTATLPADGTTAADGYAARRRRQLRDGVLVTAAIACLPALVGSSYLQNVLILTLMYAALSQSWNILGGYCGQVSLGHALYFGVGAYATSVLYVHYGVLPWGGMLAGGILAALLAMALGWMCFGLKGHYFSIATLVIAEIALLLVHNWDFVGGAMGIQWPIGPDSLATLQFARNKLPYFYCVLALFALTWVITFVVEGSKWGYWWRAVKDNTQAAESLGVTVFRSKTAAAALSAFLTAIGGSFYAAFVAYIDPDSVMHFRFSLLIVLPTVLGGIGTLWGPLVGAAILIPLTELTRSYMGGSGSGLDLIIYGALVMAIAIWRSEGIVGYVRGRLERRRNA